MLVKGCKSRYTNAILTGCKPGDPSSLLMQ